MQGLVRCADGKMAPGCICCKHMRNPATARYVYFDDDPWEGGVYVCGDCYRKPPASVLVPDNLTVACMHCIRRLVANMTRLNSNASTSHGNASTWEANA
jgi:hypothetical protein